MGCSGQTVGNLKETILSFMSSQNAAVMTALADQKVVMSKLVEKEAVACSAKSCFPLSCAEDSFKIDEKVVPENRSLFISTLRNFLQNSVKKNLEKVLSSAVIMDYNVDGTHGKKGLKDHSKFYSVFLEKCIQDLVVANMRSRTIRNSSSRNKWFNSMFKKLKINKIRAYQAARVMDDTNSWLIYKSACKRYKQEIIKEKNKYFKLKINSATNQKEDT
ncbi:uncharacterized protein [Eurosta solidaginis]|uniref:uncharacterized protein isoform X2 n=1 Tax=Eurosta solidaginis TaxID=178769 RepID=UPI003530C522